MSNSTPSRVSAQRNFTIVPNGVIASGVSDRAFRTYVALRSYVRPGHDTFPKVSTLADMFGLSESYLRRGIAELQEAGLLIVQKRPYASVSELLSKRVLSRAVYERIKDQVTVR